MNYKITSSIKIKDLTLPNGTLLAVYGLGLEGEEGQVEVLQKPETPAPVVGSMIEGTITTSQYGKRIKKERIGGFSGGKNDPRTQEQIIRQNALGNAVAYNVAKSVLMSKMGKQGLKKALKYLTGKQIVQTATFFAQYSSGIITVVNMGDGLIKIEKTQEIKPIAETNQSVKEELPEIQVNKDTAEAVPPSDDETGYPYGNEPPKKEQEEVDASSIPF